jgi:hypothetical protein
MTSVALSCAVLLADAPSSVQQALVETASKCRRNVAGIGPMRRVQDAAGHVGDVPVVVSGAQTGEKKPAPLSAYECGCSTKLARERETHHSGARTSKFVCPKNATVYVTQRCGVVRST